MGRSGFLRRSRRTAVRVGELDDVGFGWPVAFTRAFDDG
jgi:hypothetical protein